MGGYAWVTLATNDSYSLGALVLANSLLRVGTVHQLAVLITPGVTSSMREKLSSVFNVVKEVNILDSKDQNNLRLLKRPELGITFTKLNCWRLTQFDKCVFLDADTLLLQNADELFEREEFSAAPDVGWPDCFNSGVYVYQPSEVTYDNLVKFALQTGSFDGADQGLLNLYFNEWAHKDISKHLPFIYNVCSTATYSYMPAFKQYSKNIKIIHFIGNTKPWLQHFDFETRRVQITPGLEHLHGITQQWWEIFCSSVHPVLSQQMAGLAGAFAQLTLGCARTVEQRILEDNLRRQNWESGNIDYMGRDAFDNIWSKICETISTSETPATQEKEQTPPTAAIPENISEKEVSSILSVDTPSPECAPKEEKPQECIIAPITDTTSTNKVESNIEVLPSADNPVSQEDLSKIPETKIQQQITDVVSPSAPTQESVCIAPSVPVTPQSIVDTSSAESVRLTPTIPETLADSSSILPEDSKVSEVVKVCEIQPLEVKDKKCVQPTATSETSLEESKEPPTATEVSHKPLQTETNQSQGGNEISSAIKSSEVTVISPLSDLVKGSEHQTPNTENLKIHETISQSPTVPIESIKTDEKSSDVDPETPQSAPLNEPFPQTTKLETQSAEITKATTTPQPTIEADTAKLSSPSECSLKGSSEVEPGKVITKESGISKPQEASKSSPPTVCSLKQSPELEAAQVITKESGISKPQEVSKSSPPTVCSLKQSPELEPAQVITKESGIPKPHETSKSSPSTECSLKKSSEVETSKGTTSQQIKGLGSIKPQETQKVPQAEGVKVAKSPNTAPQQSKETGASKLESQKVLAKVESEKEQKPSTKTQSSEATAVSGSQQGPAPPPRKSGGTKKASGKSKK